MVNTSVVFSPELDERQLDREVSQIDSRLEETGQMDVSMGTDGVGGVGAAGGGGGFGRLIELGQERNELLATIEEALDIEGVRSIRGGGGLLGSLSPGNLLPTGLIGGVSLGALISKVPLKSLITKIPAFATLVESANLAGELVTGKLTVDDIIEAPINVGNMLTFGAIDDDRITGAIGAITLTVGGVQLARGLGSMLGSVGIGSIVGGTLGGSALGSLFGSIGIGTLLASGSALGGAALAAYFGKIAIDQVLDNSKRATPADYVESLNPNDLIQRKTVDMDVNPTPEGHPSWQSWFDEISSGDVDRRELGLRDFNIEKAGFQGRPESLEGVNISDIGSGSNLGMGNRQILNWASPQQIREAINAEDPTRRQRRINRAVEDRGGGSQGNQQVNATVENNIEMSLEVSNPRQAQRLLENPERFIEETLRRNATVQGVFNR